MSIWFLERRTRPIIWVKSYFLVTTLHRYHHISELLCRILLPIYSWTEGWRVVGTESTIVEGGRNNRDYWWMVINESWWWTPLRALERHLQPYWIYRRPLIEVWLSLGFITECPWDWNILRGPILLNLNLTAQKFRASLILSMPINCHPWRWSFIHLFLYRGATSLTAKKLLALEKYSGYHLLDQLFLLFKACSVDFLTWRPLLWSSTFIYTRNCFCIHGSNLNSYLWCIILKTTIIVIENFWIYYWKTLSLNKSA